MQGPTHQQYYLKINIFYFKNNILKNQTTNKTILRNLILKNGMQNS